MSDYRIHVYDKAFCPVCHRSISISKTGVMRPHKATSRTSYAWGQCAGAGRTYKPEEQSR